MTKPEARLQAKALRAQGFSLGAIAKELEVAKSSISVWVRDIPLTTEQRQALRPKKQRTPRTIRRLDRSKTGILGVPVRNRYSPKGDYIKLYLENGRVVEEHRYLMVNHLGRELESWEVIHHRDEDKTNNDLANLEILTNDEHARWHARRRR